MLMLTRAPGEKIFIHHPHTMEVLGEVLYLNRRGDQITLGLDFPQSLSVNREEIYKQVLSEKVQTAAFKASDLEEEASTPPTRIEFKENKLANRGC